MICVKCFKGLFNNMNFEEKEKVKAKNFLLIYDHLIITCPNCGQKKSRIILEEGEEKPLAEENPRQELKLFQCACFPVF